LLNTAKKTDYLWERTGGCKLIDTKNTSVPDHFLPPKDRGDEEKETLLFETIEKGRRSTRSTKKEKSGRARGKKTTNKLIINTNETQQTDSRWPTTASRRP
jgi:hypothetical protein